MEVLRLKNVLSRKHLVAFLLSLFCVFLVEFVLLFYKYNFFAGGFSQPFVFLNFTDRFSFLSLSLLFDVMFMLPLLWGWLFFTSYFKKRNIISAIYFFIVVTGVLSTIVAAKYQLLKYFSDAINLVILKNLAGGSLESAIAYVSDEMFLIVTIFLLVVLAVFIFVKLINNLNVVKGSQEKVGAIEFRWLFVLGYLLLLVSVSLFVLTKPDLRYGLSKKISYGVLTHVLNRISDIDFDGYGSFAHPIDSAINNPQIFPGAIDIPGNGIDEDGILGDFMLENVENRQNEQENYIANQRKHVLLIVVESARQDLLFRSVDGKEVAPTINNIAKKGTNVLNAYSHTGYTTSSIKAIFNQSEATSFRKSFIHILENHGYSMSFISAQAESFGGVAESVGMTHPNHFLFDASSAIEERVFSSKALGSLRLSEEKIVDVFKTRMNEVDFSSPQFFYVNVQAAHFPYATNKMKNILVDEQIPRHKINRENKDWLQKTYWNAIASADWAVAQIVAELKRKQVLANTTIVIASDHGESLFEDGFLGHGHNNNDLQTKIPLIFSDPEMQVNQVIGQSDIGDMIVRSAIGLKNEWLDQQATVFQVVGSLKFPVLISHVFNDGLRLSYDFRTNMVYIEKLDKWFVLDKIEKDKDYGHLVQDLIFEWESLRFEAYRVKEATSK